MPEMSDSPSSKSYGFFRQLAQDAQQLARANAKHGIPVASQIFREVATTDGFQLLTLQRLRERARGKIPGLNHLLRRTMTVVYGLEIGNDVTLGEGVSFVHPIGIVIGGDAVIGNRVRFMGSNTVGTAKDNGYPIIEDDVTIGAGARILGPIRIGRGAVIGANAVVVRDVPAGATVVGVPGVIRLPALDGTSGKAS
jgi:serine O-acetyltransferase